MLPPTPSTAVPTSTLPVATAIGTNDRVVLLRPDEPLDKNKLSTAPASLLGGGFSIVQLPNGTYLPNPALATYLDAGGDLYWMSLNSAGQRQQVNAGTSASNTAGQNAAAVNALRTTLLAQ